MKYSALWNGLLLAGLLFLRASGAESFAVKLADPVYPKLTAQSYPVATLLDEQGFPIGYKLKLMTGVCRDEVCRPLSVTLFWDALGNYTRLEHAPASPLTKREHDPFDRPDYDRLDSILKDRDSILGTKPLGWFLRVVNSDVDAVSSATAVNTQDAVVPGAAYTTWVLWHWVNGNVRQQLKARTADSATEEYLLHCLSLNAQHKAFAFEQLKALPDPEPALWTQLSEQLVRMSAYHDIHAVLDLLKERAGSCEEVRGNVNDLLNRDNRFVARLAEEFLED